jgi:hypothetical protein
MKTTVTENRSTTTKKWSKTLTGEGGRERIATIEAEQDDRDGGDTTRRIRICTNTEGYAINKRDRKNENGGSPTELEAMNQLNQAREELQEEAEDRARGQRVAEWQPDGSQRRNTQGEVATEEAAEARIENAKRDIITQLQ